MIYKMRNEMSSKELNNLIEYLKGNNIIIVEVGSYAGESASVFAKSKRVKEIWCVDPWLPGWDDNAKASSSDYVEVEKAFDCVMKKYPNKIKKFKGTVQDFYDKHKTLKPDFVYIDAVHTYDACKKDIETSLKWKSLKWIGGHDYSKKWPGVMKIVDEKFKKPNKVFKETSWVINLKKR